MSEIDIRNDDAKVTRIRFATLDGNHCQATTIRNLNGGGVAIEENDGEGCSDVRILSKTHGENLIKALQKAIDMGWLTDW